jgi:ATP-dependent RNA helicase DHR2
MPEKVHTKFGDEPALLSTKCGPQRIPKTNSNGQKEACIPGPFQRNGVKRLRDGSPKPAAGPNLGKALTVEPSLMDGQASNGKPQGKITETGDIAPQTASVSVNGPKLLEVNGTANPALRKDLMYRAPKSQKPKLNDQSKRISEHRTPQDLRRAAAALEKARRELPIWSKKTDIRWALRNHDVLLLNGETGSGKSTQVPQFLCTEPWCRRHRIKIATKDGGEEEISVGGMIAITQPRRVAAITLAQRVAREMGSSLVKGGARGEVGYAVRFESLVPSGTKIKFVTEGILLQEMLHDPNLRKYSAVIVDEIHERSVNVDLIAGFLRTLIHGDKKGRGGVPLKVIVMSATLDLGGIEAFFAKPQTHPQYKPGKNYGRALAPHVLEYEVDGIVESSQLPQSPDESFSSWDGFSDSDNNETRKQAPIKQPAKSYPSPHKTNAVTSTRDVNGARYQSSKGAMIHHEDAIGRLNKDISNNGIAVEYIQGRQYEVDIIYEVKSSQDYLQDMLQTILQLHVKEPLPGDILAFLTGQDEIETLQAELESYAEKLVKTLPKMKVMALYGSLPAQAQQEAFEKVKESFTRKIVLATNIAETSVTVSGVRFVVDCGKSKVKQYRPRLGLESLLSKPISRVSAIQRAGRAGREAKGKCFRVYTEEDYLKLEQDELPEILRSDVIDAVLKMKARGVENVLNFPLMDSPDILSMEKALVQLHMMGALDDQGGLTDIGKNMASFPLPAAYGRVLVAAASSDVLLEVIDVISCLTTDSEVFIQPKSDEEMDRVNENRKDILIPQSDVLTLLTTMRQYAAHNTDRAEWCRQRLVSVRAMKMAMSIRKQLRGLCLEQKLLAKAPPADPQSELQPMQADALLKTFVRAFASRTALLAPDGKYVTTQGRNTIAIHPSSVLHGARRPEAIMFLEHVFTAKNYAKKVSAIQANWIEEVFEV